MTTGHADGVITLDLAEGDDGHREPLRVRLAEPYRTLLGHFRHETGHYYWKRPGRGRPRRCRCSARCSATSARTTPRRSQAHYDTDPTPDWAETHVSIYATAHPWEDWAETFAHYLHIRDALQTAAAFGIVVAGPEVDAAPDPTAPLTSVPMEEHRDFDELIDSWLPLTYALNAVNRSMGKKRPLPVRAVPDGAGEAPPGARAGHAQAACTSAMTIFSGLLIASNAPLALRAVDAARAPGSGRPARTGRTCP